MRTQASSRALSVLAIAAALVAFTGCGGSDKKSSSSSSTTPASTSQSGGSGDVAAYKAGVKKVGTDLQTSLQTSLSKIGGGQTLSAKIASLDAVKQSVTKAADGFAALNPPANLKADNDELVSEMRQFASIVDDAKTAAQNGDKQKLATVQPRLNAIQTKLGQTLARIQSKGGGQRPAARSHSFLGQLSACSEEAVLRCSAWMQR